MVKRRKFTPKFKAQVALEVISGVKSAAEACREHSLKPSVVSDWKATLMTNAANAFDNPVERSREQEQIAELERMVGRQTIKLDIQKKSFQHLELKADEKRAVTGKLAETYPIQVICEALGLPRSTYYYHTQAKDDQQVRAAIEEVAHQWPTYGYRRMAQQLHREKGWIINNKRVRRLMKEMGIQAKIKRKKRRTTNSEHGFPRYPNLVLDLKVIRPDQVWVADITYLRLQQEFVYLAVIMDVFTRSIRGWRLGRGLDQELTWEALKPAMLGRLPEIHHSDQGVQYAATAYVDLLLEHGVAISMTDKGEAWQNGYAERLMRTIKEEEVGLSGYQDYNDAYDQIGRFLDDVYMHKRIHSSLGCLTPAEFESQWLAQRYVKELCS